MKLRAILATAACLSFPALAPLAAHAQPVTGPYVSLGGGTSILNPTNLNETGYNAFYKTEYGGKLQFRPSYAFEVSLGYGLGDGFRVEGEFNYNHNTLHGDVTTTSSGANAGPVRAYGAQITYGGMFNVLYDVPVGLPVFPYVGAGIGYEVADFSPKLFDSYNGASTGSAGSFAYQVIGGVSYPLAAVPGLSLTAEYRFQQLVASRSYVESYDNVRYKESIGQQSSHTFLLGLRYQLFNPPPAPVVPAAAPVAAPAPAPAKTYLVFFDWNKYNLTPRADQIIAQAASDSKTTKVTTINVSGYTDTSGTATYNQGLSVRRAKAVAVKLMADGVAASEISIRAYGETHLLVPTGPGVREPQNRRVEIVLN